MDTEIKAKGSRTITKKKYYELEKIYNSIFSPEQAKMALNAFKTLMNFDPEISIYNEQIKKTIMERRHRLNTKDTYI